MTGVAYCSTLCLILCGLATAPAPAQHEKSELPILLFNSADVSPLAIEAAMSEVDAILGRIGVSVDWVLAGAGGIDVPQQRFHVLALIVPTEPTHWELPRSTMGVTYVVDERPDTLVVFTPALDRVVGEQHHPGKTGRAIGRVIVHELIHVLAPDRGHSDEGLMARSQRGRDLYGGCLELDEESASAFLRGVAAFGVAGPVDDPGR